MMSDIVMTMDDGMWMGLVDVKTTYAHMKKKEH